MSTQPGAVAPYTIPGEIVTPDAVLDPQSMPAHDFFNTIRDLLHKVTYHNESDLHTALDTVDRFEHRFIPVQDRAHVVQEGDHAGREDVTMRKPPQVGGNVPMPAAPQLDYGMLARAILAAQREQEQENSSPPPASDSPAATPAV